MRKEIRVCQQCGNEFERVIGPGQPAKRCFDCREAQRVFRQTQGTTTRFTPGDKRLIEDIKEELGISHAEAIRTALRVYHAILMQSKK